MSCKYLCERGTALAHYLYPGMSLLLLTRMAAKVLSRGAGEPGRLLKIRPAIRGQERTLCLTHKYFSGLLSKRERCRSSGSERDDGKRRDIDGE